MASLVARKDDLAPLTPDEELPEQGTTVDLGGPKTEIHDGTAFTPVAGGGMVVDMAPGADGAFSQAATPPDWNANLANLLSDQERMSIATDLIEAVESDERSRQDWYDRCARGLELLGMKDEKSKGPFKGASALRHPLIAQACVQFQARALKELCPPGGPVKGAVLGQSNPDLEAQATRVENHMNWQLTEQDPAHFWEEDQNLFLLPLQGSSFKKIYFDETVGYTVERTVPAKDMIVPYSATSLATAPRVTHRQFITQGDMRRYMASGFYRRCDLPDPGSEYHGPSNIKDREDEADGKNDGDPVRGDIRHTVFEVHVDYDVPGFEDPDDVPLAWIITVDRESREVLGVRRNWAEKDPKKKKIAWFSKRRYLPGIGFYDFGIPHAIGSLAEGATGAMRALLDAAAFATVQGGFKSKDINVKGGQIEIEPGVWKDIDCTAEELKNGFYTPPFKEPSEALFKMLGLMVESGKEFASVTESMTGDAPNTGPVGTTVALIEQGSMVYSGIHLRLHASRREELAIRARLNYENLPDEYAYTVRGGQQLVNREDYDGRVDVAPVSDPNIISQSQRIAVAQAVTQLDLQFTGVMDRREVVKGMLTVLKAPNIDALLPDPQSKIVRTDPVTENSLMMIGHPVRAYSDQEHQAHIQVHVAFMMHPGLGGNPEVQKVMGPAMVSHIAEHIAWANRMAFLKQGIPLSPVDESDPHGQMVKPLPPAIENEIAVRTAQAVGVLQQVAGLPDLSGAAQHGQGEDAKAQADIKRKDDAHQADEARKATTFQAEEQRKQVAAEAERKRQDDAAQAERDRTALAETQRREHEKVAAAEKLRADQEASQTKIGIQQREAEAKDTGTALEQLKGDLSTELEQKVNEMGDNFAQAIQQLADSQAKLAEGVMALAKAASAKKKITMDADGNPIGIEPDMGEPEGGAAAPEEGA